MFGRLLINMLIGGCLLVDSQPEPIGNVVDMKEWQHRHYARATLERFDRYALSNLS